MKSTLLTLMVLCGLLAFAGSALSYTVGTTDVGGLDTYLYKTSLSNSGDVTELDWVKSVLQDDTLTLDEKYTKMTWQNTNVDGTIALDLKGEPAYFMLKLGNSKGIDYDHILFKNNDELSWAVVQLSTSDYTIVEVGKISHIDEIGTPPQETPEPGTIMLLGGGLLGLGFFGWRRSRG